MKIIQKVRVDIKFLKLMGYTKIMGFIGAALNNKDDIVLLGGGYVAFF